MREDPRWERLAKVLTGYSVAVAPGSRVLITMLEPETFPLVRAVHAGVVRAGGCAQVELQSAALERDLLLHGSGAQLDWVPELSRLGMEWADINIAVRGSSDPALLAGMPAERIAAHRRALGTISALRTAQTRWVIVRVPGEPLARQAGLALADLEEMFFRAALLDWRQEAEEYRRIRSLFDGGSRVRIVGPGTDLSFATHGRRYVVEDGHINMPGGELYTAPVEDSVEGVIRFNVPGVFAGQSVPGIALRLAAGRVVSASADANEDLLNSLLATDDGAARIGEFGVGLNRALDRPCGEPFYDEKILGTVHLALGRSYAECGGRNYSALHWDLVMDLRRRGARVWVDERLVIEDGRFVDAGRAG